MEDVKRQVLRDKAKITQSIRQDIVKGTMPDDSVVLPGSNRGQNRIAVLDFNDSTGGHMNSAEMKYIADLVRGVVRQSLPISRYYVMTRDNVIALLPPGYSLSECIGECVVDTGRLIDAHYVVAGEVTMFGGELRVTVHMYDCTDGNLLGQCRIGARSELGIEGPLEQKTMELLRILAH